MSSRGYALVFGGSRQGLMGVLARTVREGGGESLGVISKDLSDQGFASDDVDDLVVAADLRERKAKMELYADAFVALPGGFGTLDELFDIIARRLSDAHSKPIALVNTDRYYDLLMQFLDHMFRQRFAVADPSHLLELSHDPAQALAYIEQQWSTVKCPTSPESAAAFKPLQVKPLTIL